MYLQKRGQKLEIRTWRVPTQYTDLKARRHAVALLVHEELSLHSSCGKLWVTPYTGDVHVLYSQ
jgi:hypothetical protein